MRYLISFLLMPCFISLTAQTPSPYEKHTYVDGQDTLKYRLLYPENFDPDHTYPLILFLHGAGERGSDNEKQLTHGSGLFLDPMVRKAFPAVVIFPQCPANDYWASVRIDRSQPGPIRLDFSEDLPPTRPMVLVQQLLDSMRNESFTDDSRLYVMGLSMGGMGTFDIVSRNPELFAAAVPICGGGNPELAGRYATQTPMWIFHGAIDGVVSPEHSIRMALAIQQAGGAPALTIFPYTNHNSWDPAFAKPELLPWLFGHRK